jgi:hypothetical protein
VRHVQRGEVTGAGQQAERVAQGDEQVALVVAVVRGQDVVAGLVFDRGEDEVVFPGDRRPAEGVGGGDDDVVAEAGYARDKQRRLYPIA